jgi:hypothetical protein
VGGFNRESRGFYKYFCDAVFWLSFILLCGFGLWGSLPNKRRVLAVGVIEISVEKRVVTC